VINSHYVRGWINRRYIFYNLGTYDDKLKVYDRAIDIDPQNIDVFFNLGYALTAMGRCDEANWPFNRVAELDPKYPNLSANRRIAEMNRDEATPFLVEYTPWIGISSLTIGGIGIWMYRWKKRK